MRPELMTLSLDDFLRRFLLHLLPKGFVRIRNFGFLANRKRATTLPLCFQSLRTAPEQQLQRDTSSAQLSNTWRCPQCGAPMAIFERLSASEIQLRSPPLAA
jgi:rubredoxin